MKLKSQLHKNISSSGTVYFSPACAHLKSSHINIRLQQPIGPTRFADNKCKITRNCCHALGWRRQPLQRFGVLLRYSGAAESEGRRAFWRPPSLLKPAVSFVQHNWFASIALPIFWQACFVFKRLANYKSGGNFTQVLKCQGWKKIIFLFFFFWVTIWGRWTYSTGYPARCTPAGSGSTSEPPPNYLLSPPVLTLENLCCWSLLSSTSRIRWSNFVKQNQEEPPGGAGAGGVGCSSGASFVIEVLERTGKEPTQGTQVSVARGSPSGYHSTAMCPMAGAVRVVGSSLARAGQKNALAD